MNKHTPGPWQYSTGNTEALIIDRDGFTIMELRTTLNTTSHRDIEANARLIAAAPDLLEALQFLVEWCELMGTRADNSRLLRAITEIEKATGGNNES